MSMIQGIHHISLSCETPEQYAKACDFYKRILELKEVAVWDGGCLLDTGSGIVEIFNDGKKELPEGAIRHFAFLVEDPDACIEKVRKEGYKITDEPRMAQLGSGPVWKLRVGFCEGPVGESVEFFHIREIAE